MERLILDTAALVAAERGGTHLDALIGDEDDVAIAAITAAELLVGVGLADRRHHGTRSRFVEAILEAIPVEPYDIETARSHATLLAHTKRAGRARGAHDLIIAATGITTNRTVVTTDAAGFEDLPGVLLRLAA